MLNRIASKWRQRSFNIESLAVGHSEMPGLSRMTFVVDANANAEQVVRQLDKLVDVVDIRDVSHEEIVGRELAMVKVKARRRRAATIIDIAEVFKAEIVDVAPDSMIIEATGDETKIDSLVVLLQDYEIIELVRTGKRRDARGLGDIARAEAGRGAVRARARGTHVVSHQAQAIEHALRSPETYPQARRRYSSP